MRTESKPENGASREKDYDLMIRNGFTKTYQANIHEEEEDGYKVNIWKLLTCLFVIISTILFTVLLAMCLLSRGAVHSGRTNEDTGDGVATRRSTHAHDGDKRRSSSRGSGIFSELSRQEIDNVLDFLNRQEELNLVGPKEAWVDSNFIHSIEMKFPEKEQVLSYLDGGLDTPKRMATVYIFRGGENPPVVEEYVVGDIPNVTYGHRVNTTQRKTKIPFTMRPFSTAEFRAIFRYVIPNVTAMASHVFQESYGATPLDCGDRCLRFSMAPIASSFIRQGTRKAWFWFQYDMEFPSIRPLDFQFLADTTSVDPSKWTFEKVWYCNQMFDNFTIFLMKYNDNAINKTRISYPTGKYARYGTMEFRHPLFPEEELRAPRQIEPDGPRFTIIENEIHYAKWKLNFRVSASGGLQLLNIRFGGDRIIYELSMQEVAVLYSGNNPVSRIMNYADGAGMYGTRYRGLMPGADCPGHAQFVDTYLYSSNEFGGRIFENAFCVFELNTHSILRRHRAYGRTGAYYGGLEAIVLVVRSIISIVNYDYVFDFMFYQNGVIETKVSMTGYLGTSFYSPAESIYSAHVHKYVAAGLHNHLFHFKVDIDSKGTKNRYETLDIKLRNETDPWNPNGYHIQPVFEHNLKQTEKAARAGSDINSPKYHVISQHSDPSELGNTRGFRLVLNKLSKQLLPEGYGFEPAISWARQQLAVTRYRADEERSSSLFTMWDAADPVVNFQQYLDNDENLVDEDLVAWISLGVQHLPQTENLPLTCAIGTQLSFHIMPFNYFDEDPSMHSRDAVRITPLDKTKPLEGAHIEQYGALNSSGCIPHNYPVERLKRNSTFLFS